MLGSRSWRGLMWRNLIYRKRNKLGTLLEFVLPIAFVGFLVWIKRSVEGSDNFAPETVEAFFPGNTETFQIFSFTDYVTAMQAKRKCKEIEPHFRSPSGATKDFGITGIEMNGFNWQVPFVLCDSRLCTEDGQDAVPFCQYLALGLAASDESDGVGWDQAVAFREYIYNRYPQLANKTELPFGFDFIQLFTSENDVVTNVTSEAYENVDVPKLALAVVFDGTDESYNFTYKIRVNSTGFNAPEDTARPGFPTTPPTDKNFEHYAKEDLNSCPLIDGTAEMGPYRNSCTGQYVYNGFLTTQRLVHDFIMDHTGSKAKGYYVSEHGVQYSPFPSPQYEEDGFYAAIAAIGPLFVTLGILYPVAAMLRYIVLEKQLRQKELLKIMSVTESDIGWAWYTSFVALHLLTAVGAAATTTQLYSNSSFVLLLVFWLFTMMAIVSFTFFMAALFSNATRATLVGLLVFLVGYFLTFIVDFQDDPQTSIALVSLHPAGAFAYGLQEIGRLEDLAVGLTMNTVRTTDSPSGYTFANTCQNLILDCILWGLLGWYANRVVPSDYGRPLPWYFPVSISYWCPKSTPSLINQEDRRPPLNDGVLMEEVSKSLKEQAGQRKSIEIRNLRKTFGEKIAVDGLGVSFYNGQITALLGHNGAGKTTTINLLTGTLAPTEGFATIAGKDIRTQMDEIRQDIGICFQHDCLFPELTVKEHIQFFARVKGTYERMNALEVEEKVTTSIQDVALSEKRNTLAKNLSGGMKRKLSVAIAFCGDSKTVFLDEPTSGMDPFSRRFTWNVIRHYRQDRRIILTTHNMDEADILGDRIAILAEGQLRCLGSSLFLKRAYGVGYHLTVEKRVKSNDLKTSDSNSKHNYTETTSGAMTSKNKIDDIVQNIVTNAVPDATLLTNVGTEISFQLPLGASSEFASMLGQLDDRVDEGSVVAYGVGITTLDEVFLLVARGETNEKKDFASSGHDIGKNADATIDDEKSIASGMNLENEGLFARHVGALMKKRAANFKRDKKAWCCTTILPSLFVLIGFLLFEFAGVDRNFGALTLELDGFNVAIDSEPRNPIPFNNGSAYTCQPGFCVYGFEQFIKYVDIPTVKGPPFESQIIGPIINESSTGELYSFCGAQSYIGPNATCSIRESENVLHRITEAGAEPIGSNVLSVTNASHSIMDSSKTFAATQYGGLYFTHEPESMIQNITICVPEDESSSLLNPLECFEFTTSDAPGDGLDLGYDKLWVCLADCPANSFELGEFDLPYSDVVLERCKRTKGDYLNEQECENYSGIGYLLRYNYTALHATPLYQTLADEAIVREGLNTTNFKIRTVVHPLPQTYVEERIAEADNAYGAWFLVVLSFPFICGSFATFVVTERESKAKHLQTVAGVKPASYWLSTWLWDLANYQFPLWITVILMFAFDVKVFTTTERGVLGGVISLLVLYGPSAASYAYCISFMFTSPSVCNLVIIISSFLIGLGGSFATFILRMIGSDPSDPNQKLVDAANITEWVLRFIPSFSLSKGLFNVLYIGAFEWMKGERITVWDDSVLLYEVIFMGWQSILYLLLAMKLDEWSSNPHALSIWHRFLDIITCQWDRDRSAMDIPVAVPDDGDVLAEQERVLSGRANDDLIVTSQLTKVYGNGKLAVNNLSLGIPPGQCFGLLGINGAGKTTAMGMLTAEFAPTSGDASLAGFSVLNEPEKTRRRVGYCPQFDAHFSNLTGREHVELYASIKGVPAHLVKEAAAAKLAEVGLSETDSDRLSSTYSGGMKRRLSLACATIGRPQIVFLDECTTGVDPVARREIWHMISDMVTGQNLSQDEKTSVVLTTHSMEECEALCPRIGIMANGKLRCLGSAQHLKTKFGQGYQVEMKVKNVEVSDEDYLGNLKDIADAIHVNLPTSKVIDQECAMENNTEPSSPDNVFLSMDQTVHALASLTGDNFLTAMVAETDAIGYLIYKEASTPIGVDIDTLALFATNELRMRNLNEYVAQTYPNSLLRERQDTKARYEVASEGTKMARIFESIEENKERLLVAEYGVSQTTLEQVFNMHAAEAEKLKQGTLDT